jgi:hypothetical protein
LLVALHLVDLLGGAAGEEEDGEHGDGESVHGFLVKRSTAETRRARRRTEKKELRKDREDAKGAKKMLGGGCAAETRRHREYKHRFFALFSLCPRYLCGC